MEDPGVSLIRWSVELGKFWKQRTYETDPDPGESVPLLLHAVILVDVSCAPRRRSAPGAGSMQLESRLRYAQRLENFGELWHLRELQGLVLQWRLALLA